MSLLDFYRDMDRQMMNADSWTKSLQAPTLKMELKENKNEYDVLVEVPGIAKEELKISCENGVLMVAAEHKEEKKSKEQKIHFSERSYGYCSRQLRLPNNIDANSIAAKYENGVLAIKIPKLDKKEGSNLIKIE